jgi:hypothetical protein
MQHIFASMCLCTHEIPLCDIYQVKDIYFKQINKKKYKLFVYLMSACSECFYWNWRSTRASRIKTTSFTLSWAHCQNQYTSYHSIYILRTRLPNLHWNMRTFPQPLTISSRNILKLKQLLLNLFFKSCFPHEIYICHYVCIHTICLYVTCIR